MLLKWKKEKKNKTTRLSTPPPYPSRVLLTGCTERMLQRHAFCNHCRLSGSNVNVRRWRLSLFLFFWGGEVRRRKRSTVILDTYNEGKSRYKGGEWKRGREVERECPHHHAAVAYRCPCCVGALPELRCTLVVRQLHSVGGRRSGFKPEDAAF